MNPTRHSSCSPRHMLRLLCPVVWPKHLQSSLLCTCNTLLSCGHDWHNSGTCCWIGSPYLQFCRQCLWLCHSPMCLDSQRSCGRICDICYMSLWIVWQKICRAPHHCTEKQLWEHAHLSSQNSCLVLLYKHAMIVVQYAILWWSRWFDHSPYLT